MQSTDSPSYTKTAKVLHWLIALAIIFMLILGWSFDFLPRGETKFALFQLHKSVGITILLLSLLRLGWRLGHRAPPLPTSMARWEQNAAHLGHFLLYTAMILMPLSGWVMVSASSHNVPTILYGFVPWPNVPVPADNKQAVDHLTHDIHGLTAYVLALLVGGHAAAALKHHFISKDDVLLRMAPRSLTGFLNRLRGKI